MSLVREVRQVEYQPEEAAVEAAVDALGILSPVGLARAFDMIASIYRQDADRLRSDWADSEAGDVWDIAAEGLETTANTIRECWDKL